MLKYQLYQHSDKNERKQPPVCSSDAPLSHQVNNVPQWDELKSNLRQQISEHPGVAVNLGVLSGFLIGWWVKR